MLQSGPKRLKAWSAGYPFSPRMFWSQRHRKKIITCKYTFGGNSVLGERGEMCPKMQFFSREIPRQSAVGEFVNSLLITCVVFSIYIYIETVMARLRQDSALMAMLKTFRGATGPSQLELPLRAWTPPNPSPDLIWTRFSHDSELKSPYSGPHRVKIGSKSGAGEGFGGGRG